MADKYVALTMVGDPLADAVVADLAHLPPAEVHRTIKRALAHGGVPAGTGDDMPESMRRLLARYAELPDWYDEEMASVAATTFVRHSESVSAALVCGSIVEGFATLISKSFRIRGRVMTQGRRRLMQNLLQLIEQYMPGGMHPGGDGWRLTLRARLVHAQARAFLREAPEWSHEDYGLPISAATIYFAACAFSGRLMQHVRTLGADISDEEQEAYVHVWRWTASVLGVPDEVLFTDMVSSLRGYRLASLCEPTADYDEIIMANSIVNSAPLVMGAKTAARRRRLATLLYQVSRELIGDGMADDLMYPASWRLRVVPLLRVANRMNRTIGKLWPAYRRKYALTRFNLLMQMSDINALRHSYMLPTALYDEHSADW